MPIDPKIRLPPSPVRLPVAKPAVPSVVAHPAPAAVAAPNQINSFDAVPANQYAGVRDPSIGVRDNSIGVRDNSIGVRDNSIGVRDNSIGVRDNSIGDPAGGVRDHSIGGNDGSGGVRDHSIGNLGPDLTEYEKSIKSTIAKYLEQPSYLRDNPPEAPARGASLTDAKATVGAMLTSKEATRLLDAAGKKPQVGDRLATVVAGIKTLPAESQKALLSKLAGSPDSPSAKVLEHVVGSSAFKGLSAGDKTSLARVMSVAGEPALVGLGALIEGTPECVNFKDSQGKSLFANLADLAGQPLNTRLYGATSGPQLLDQALLQVANPDRVAQGSAPTCTVTSMQFELVRDDPAEYARLLTGLAGPTGRATMVGGGELKLLPASATTLDKREAAQAIFQDAAMDYGNGADVYDAKNAISRSAGGDYPGLMPRQQTTMLRQLFGVKYETDTLETPTSRASALVQLRDYVSVGKNRPVLLEIDQGNFNHVVTFEMEKNSRVYFRDPYGQLRSMPDAAFIDHVVAVHKPQTMPS